MCRLCVNSLFIYPFLLLNRNLSLKKMNDLEEFPSPKIIKQALENFANVPIIFKNQLKSWTSIPTTVDSVEEKSGSTLLEFRIVSNSLQDIAWEGNACYVKATISQFIAWQSCEHKVSPPNPFSQFDNKEFWAYSSYNYMNMIFTDDSPFMQNINWSSFGFPEVTGKDSSFWIGSKGAYTPCHVDTYGFNLVAQILGRKKWILFPPEDGKFMYPTRIPYEESSIFSSVNILNPDLKLHPNFKKTHPHVVVLESGDVLFVPKGWWHFVYSLDCITTSINTWIKLPSDCESHLNEGITKVLMTALIPLYEPEEEIWLNPKEELVSPEETLNYIITTLKDLENKTVSTEDSFFSKHMKTEKELNIPSRKCSDIFNYKNIITVKPSLEFLDKIQYESRGSTKNCDITIKQIMNCFVHPDVVKLIGQLLKQL